MKLKDYILDKLVAICIFGFCFGILLSFLFIFNVNHYVRVYVILFVLLPNIVIFFMDFIKKKVYFEDLYEKLETLDQKYLIAELLKKPNFLEGKILCDIIRQTDKSMTDHVNQYKFDMKAYREYIELWVHEIKTPIASSKLILENHKNETEESLNEELEKIENFVEQALYYARSNTVHKDYIIKKYSLKNIVHDVIKKNKNNLIRKKIKIELENLDVEVNSDSKWLGYILAQILSNSIKYSSHEQAVISIFAKENKENIELIIKDNGIGIKEKDIARVFEKGFTGTNGRNVTTSTGMGLYLCKKLLIKLGHDIQISSKENEGTTVTIIFPKNSMFFRNEGNKNKE